jgi:Ni,Fe-hydrogenase III small subunit
VVVRGCPPEPDAIRAGLKEAARRLQERRAAT